jgi:16S rRNA (cytosine1402-N4)-methyltransferase
VSPEFEDNPQSVPPNDRTRRPRYRGTHPRRFEQRYKELDPDAHPELLEHVKSQGRTPAGSHLPVMAEEVLAALDPQPGDAVADCTVGFGGHAVRFLERIGSQGRLIGLDVDGGELERTRVRLAGCAACPKSQVHLHRSHYAELPAVMREEGLTGFDVVFADLGVSSMQIDDPARGFSYKHDGPLDMRMDDRCTKTAADLLRTLDESALEQALRDLSGEPEATRIARLIVRRREREAITTTRQLVQLAFDAKGLTRRAWREKSSEQPTALHPAALVFQAIRILVNDELAGLERFLRIAPHCLCPGGRLGILSFHSGEDRLVKRAFREAIQQRLLEGATETGLRPGAAEKCANPRSASARFRWLHRTSG